MKRRVGLLSHLAILSLALVGSFPAAGAPAGGLDEEANQLQSLVEKIAPSIVTVKVVLKTDSRLGGGQEQESRMEMQGVVVDKDGLIMVSNTPFSPGRFMGMFGGPGGDAPGFKMTPTDIKVIFENEEKEFPAFMAATDTKLDLAFIKIEDLGGRPVMPVDFGSAASVGIGQKVVSISRMRKGYDYAPYFQSARISGAILKPRRAYALDGSISEFGLPVYTLAGEVVGVLTTIESGVQEDSSGAAANFAILMRLMGAGGSSGAIRAFLVPGATINGVIAQARQQAATKAAERAKQKAAKPAGKPGTESNKKPDKPQKP